MDKHLKNLGSYDEKLRKEAAKALLLVGEDAFSSVAALLEHEVARWEVISLLAQISPSRAIPEILKIANFEREKSVQELEHAKKYIRIRAIQELGDLGEKADLSILRLFAQHKVEDSLAYFINPKRPHLHQEVIDAVLLALKKIATPQARRAISLWERK